MRDGRWVLYGIEGGIIMAVPKEEEGECFDVGGEVGLWGGKGIWGWAVMGG